MSETTKPTICVECKHMEAGPGVTLVSGAMTQHRYCQAEAERLNFVTGEKYTPKPFCQVKNFNGKCVDYVAKEA